MAFLDHQEDPQLLWKVLEDTWSDVSISQFPEVKSKVLSHDLVWVSIRQELLARLLADESMEVQREDLIISPRKVSPMEVQ